MILNVLAVGDVVGESGVEYLNRHLRSLKKLHEVHFTVVNGENASGVGILPRQARDIFDAGADVITLGNHTWNRIQIADFLEDDRYTLRPANYTNRVPGRGWGVYDGPKGLRIGVMNLIGRCEMDSNFENPFTTADKVLKRMEGVDVVLVDFHAEATSEKGAMGYYLDGRVQALWGTHTQPAACWASGPTRPSTASWEDCPGDLSRRRAPASWRASSSPSIPTPANAWVWSGWTCGTDQACGFQKSGAATFLRGRQPAARRQSLHLRAEKCFLRRICRRRKRDYDFCSRLRARTLRGAFLTAFSAFS